MKIAGVDELFEISEQQVKAIDRFTDSVVDHLDELASEKCTHGISCNDPCPECDLDDAINGQNDSEAAAEEAFSRINP